MRGLAAYPMGQRKRKQMAARRTGYDYDVLVIGSGLAGLTVALQLPSHLRVAILSKGTLTEGATPYAQGGVSAALDAADSVEAHVAEDLSTLMERIEAFRWRFAIVALILLGIMLAAQRLIVRAISMKTGSTCSRQDAQSLCSWGHPRSTASCGSHSAGSLRFMISLLNGKRGRSKILKDGSLVCN